MSPHYDLSDRQVVDLHMLSAKKFSEKWDIPMGSVGYLRQKYRVKPHRITPGPRIKLRGRMLSDLHRMRPFAFARKYHMSPHKAMYLRQREGIHRVKVVFNFPYGQHRKELATMSAPEFAEKYGMQPRQVFVYRKKLGIKGVVGRRRKDGRASGKAV